MSETTASFPVPELEARARRCADALRDADAVLLASHIDADGLTSAGVASQALSRAGIDHETRFENQLGPEEIADIAATEYDTVLFTDFGSGQLDEIVEYDFTPVVADHHQLADVDIEHHLNPLLEGVDGGSELSGAGAAYVLARALGGPENRDLAALAVVGAVGDMQTEGGELVGANTVVAKEGVEAGVLDTARGLAVYGVQTRPLPKLLAYASDVHIPGITNDRQGAVRFLAGLDIDLKQGGEWPTWAELTVEEKQTVASALIRRAIRNGVSTDDVEDLVGTTYTLTEEELGTEVRDASEFSTLLNATARYERADVGLAVCLGDRDGALAEARDLLAEHRRNLSAGVRWVEEHGVTQEEHVQWFDAGDEIRDTIVGIVAGMAMSADGVRYDKPIVALARKNETELKASARGTGRLVDDGLDLSVVMGEAARAVGGDGGGHTVAAGATIPDDAVEAFVTEVGRLVAAQLA
ncbi:single-stranded-DNA-specific exonuclease RecJ [Salarchaeum japonicum]|uniref:DHH family phosphoesterase n=1 Tax=Salarchaeum japonicum TaxID=555573 RepID=A0AAV3SZU7_9EURY|nr:DHH family phosphoesterase [Salarchaeum japonicum]